MSAISGAFRVLSEGNRSHFWV